MPAKLPPKVAFATVAFGVAGYLVLTVYSQPLSTYRQIEPVRSFLSHALAHDSVSLAAEAGAQQPISWVLAATRMDSAAVREWIQSRPRVSSTQRGDTLWVTLRRPGSTKRCSPLYPLTAAFLRNDGEVHLVHLSSLCPSISRAIRPAAPVE
jgi:hypothetical protein